MSFLDKLGFRKDKPPKDPNSPKFKRFMAERLHEKHVRYVLERDEKGEDRIIAREGFIHVSNDELAIICGGVVVFRTVVLNMEAWEFMSLEGATISGFDLDKGKIRTVMAYYKYYRK
ncbi:MAG: hypothetical protein E7614_06985 [Ruminococcaceae bacterium]|nr:hypothetical protein [Oscillospiraceae bacterium]